MGGAETHLNVIRKSPLVAGTPRAHFGEPTPPFITPTAHLFVRDNFTPVEIDPRQWKLGITGAVEFPQEFNLERLRTECGRPRIQQIVKQCAGDNRIGLPEPRNGEPWGPEAYGAVEMRGYSLANLLDHARVKALFLVITGADGYERRVTMEQAMDPRVMLADMMNGEPIPLNHGGPVTSVFPGWYGMASVKNPVKIEARTERGIVYFNDNRYGILNKATGEFEPLTAMKVTSRIINMMEEDVIPAGHHTIEGRAWVGSLPVVTGKDKDTLISKVEISVDGGKTWRQADTTKAVPNMWSHFTLDWYAKEAGPIVIMSRAYDSDGNVQPFEVEQNEFGYGNNAVQRMPLHVV